MYAQLIRQLANRIEQAGPLCALGPDERRHQAQAESEAILCHVLQISRLQLLQRLSDPPPQDVLQAVHDLATRRCDGEPLAYVLGEAYFFGRPFAVRPGCLIPRPDTETLVDRALRWLNLRRPDGFVIDVGTGSGCIAITLALESPAARVVGIDLSAEALGIARANAERLSAKVDWVQADAVAWLAAAKGQRYRPNLIVSNPPYIASDELAALDVSVRDYEPRMALYGGDDGLDFYRAFANLGPAIFADGPAAFLMEVGDHQGQSVADLFSADAWRAFQVEIYRDLRDVARVVAVARS
ncbi:peptide chain release factor N(5)-glutamine methyltransferase [Alicyclobacillus acidiphilus]|uniref:peptide chain release factor N(5)-glutamine methyltransferase n=1 Tax=Alicyclobacillus acidiphilus TaxID=182455 RepID=UPI00083580DF|nr:peptide chain release factor N(5)-glutamine methyltransferase [Alicyclobacillus acidiphilus]